MIISRTPIRISFVGGGTDIANFYRGYGGKVISTAIDKYISVLYQKAAKFAQIAINTPDHHETVSNPDHIQHPLIREAVRKTRPVTGGVSITVTSDIPSRGCELGSSRALTVGSAQCPLRLSSAPKCQRWTLWRQQACEIEIERLNQPIGKPDQYIAAYGGLRRIQFNRDESVNTQKIPVTPETIARLEEHFILILHRNPTTRRDHPTQTETFSEPPDTSANQETRASVLRCSRQSFLSLRGRLFTGSRLAAEAFPLR